MLKKKPGYYYSATTKGFYPEEHKDIYAELPDDVVRISCSEHTKLIEGQSDGKVIASNERGYPILVSPPPPDESARVIMAREEKKRLLREAEIHMAPLQDAVALEMATEAEEDLLLSWKKYRVLLNRVDTNDPDNIIWPEPPEPI